MFSRKVFGCLALAPALLVGPAGSLSAQQQALPQQAPQSQRGESVRARSTNPPQARRIEMNDQQIRASLQSSLSGISVDAVMAMVEHISRSEPGHAEVESFSHLDEVDRPVTRAELNALRALPARPGADLAPGSVGPEGGALRNRPQADAALPPRSRERRGEPSPASPAAQPEVGLTPGGASPGGLPPQPATPPVSLPPGAISPGGASPPSAGGTDLVAPHLDVNGFVQDLHAALQNSAQGYTMRIRRNGQTISTLQWNWARRPADGGAGWNPDRRMNVASVSKFITAMAVVRMLHERGISPQTPIASWLPAYWTLGQNVGGVTFEMLLTHSSGLNGATPMTLSNIREAMALPVTVSQPTAFTYQNINFGLLRVLIATLGGYVDPGFVLRETLGAGFQVGGPGDVDLPGSDWFWDAISILAYADYVSKNVFMPAGVSGMSGTLNASSNATFGKTANTALAYGFAGSAGTGSGAAWNSGNLAWRAGSGGLHLSADEVLDIVGAYRYTSAIVPSAVAAAAVQNLYGLDGRWTTPVGFVYHKNGSWPNQSACNAARRQEQSLLLLMPGNMELILLVNSPVGPDCTFLRGLVEQVYRDNVK